MSLLYNRKDKKVRNAQIAAELQIPQLVLQALGVELRLNPLLQDLVLHLHCLGFWVPGLSI